MHERVAFIVEGLTRRADPARAGQMARYMKTTMPFHGVARPDLDKVVRDALRRWPIESLDDYRTTVHALWALPHREEKYAAIAIARRQERFVRAENLDLYRSMIVGGAWWDLVDDFAHVVCHLLLTDRARTRPVLDAWIDDDDLWLRRIAILSQIDAKNETDEEMLFSYCTRHMSEREFFIRKAIGWALRQYARTSPDAVLAFCEANRERMSGLTFREATKHLERPNPAVIAPKTPENVDHPRLAQRDPPS